MIIWNREVTAPLISQHKLINRLIELFRGFISMEVSTFVGMGTGTGNFSKNCLFEKENKNLFKDGIDRSDLQYFFYVESNASTTESLTAEYPIQCKIGNDNINTFEHQLIFH